MAVTIYDVAKKAGVGIGTVSRAVNDSPLISAETKARVLKVVDELKYQPHALAQGLARRRTNMIAIIVPFFTGYFYVEILKSIQNELSNNNYDMLLYNVDKPEKTELFLKKTLEGRHVDGVILISLKIPNEYAKKFIESKTPIVLVDSYYYSLDSLFVKNRNGAFCATEHLIKLGHKKIGMIDGHLKSSPAQVRLEGFKRALKKHNVQWDERYLVVSDFVAGADGFNREAGYQAMKKLLDLKKDKPTAVFVSSDIQAAGAIKAIGEAGFKIPHDTAIVGFDDIELAEFLDLTTMRQPLSKMGRLAVEILINKIRGASQKMESKSFATELVIRKSCGANYQKK